METDGVVAELHSLQHDKSYGPQAAVLRSTRAALGFFLGFFSLSLSPSLTLVVSPPESYFSHSWPPFPDL